MHAVLDPALRQLPAPAIRPSNPLPDRVPPTPVHHCATLCDTSAPPPTPQKPPQPKHRTNLPKRNTSAQETLALTPLHHQAIALLLAGRTDTAIAAALGISRSTLFRWKHYHPLFQAILNRLQAANWSATLHRLRSIYSRAAKVMDQNLRSPDPDLRFRAAQTLLIHTKPADLAPEPTLLDAGLILDEHARLLRLRKLGQDSLSDPLTMNDRAHAIEAILNLLQPDPLENDPTPAPLATPTPSPSV